MDSLQLLVLVIRATWGSGFKFALQKDLNSGVARLFDWGDIKHGYLALLVNLNKYSWSDVILLQRPKCTIWLRSCLTI